MGARRFRLTAINVDQHPAQIKRPSGHDESSRLNADRDCRVHPRQIGCVRDSYQPKQQFETEADL
ncbi:hypothetical protein MLP_08580 [Microlunatus phosphovorus NM-1]|uniref:Uncharacterized protein n=1 Tax=Microlunatus phosphovorus (strain ATCC 700054 / DSM 10555 / JCM 9379 / NBRC 101784 / NCIMB 13414 / VKM Ac-1990 / NM-1) TaxID=1032480 RepID=F5XLZ3_MICPN|nr:hypothetical protein MLP_08580 [Microlunatus phosphovorus NM-1]